LRSPVPAQNSAKQGHWGKQSDDLEVPRPRSEFVAMGVSAARFTDSSEWLFGSLQSDVTPA